MNLKNSVSKSNSGLDSISIAFLDTNPTENTASEIQQFKEYFKGNDFKDYQFNYNNRYNQNKENLIQKNKSFNKSKNYKQEIMLEIEKNSKEELQNILDKEYDPYQSREILNSLSLILISIFASILTMYFDLM